MNLILCCGHLGFQYGSYVNLYWYFAKKTTGHGLVKFILLVKFLVLYKYIVGDTQSDEYFGSHLGFT